MTHVQFFISLADLLSRSYCERCQYDVCFINVTPVEKRPERESRLLKPTPATSHHATQALAPLPVQKIKTDCPMEGGTGLAPHPTDCSKFINCWKGTAHTQQCGPGTLFNPQTLQCDFPYNVNCIVSAPSPQGELYEDKFIFFNIIYLQQL
jgi:hypothetical protein